MFLWEVFDFFRWYFFSYTSVQLEPHNHNLFNNEVNPNMN